MDPVIKKEQERKKAKEVVGLSFLTNIFNKTNKLIITDKK